MTRQIRLLGVTLMVCFAILFVQLNRLTVFEAAKLNDNPDNTREILRDFTKPRGTVTTADGVVIAQSARGSSMSSRRGSSSSPAVTSRRRSPRSTSGLPGSTARRT